MAGGVDRGQRSHQRQRRVEQADQVAARREERGVAQVGHDGLARTIRPVHTAMDGDTLFALATGKNATPVDLMQLATAAGEVTAMAVTNAIRHARTLRIGSNWFPACAELTDS